MSSYRTLSLLLCLLLETATSLAQLACRVTGTIKGLGNQNVLFSYQQQGKQLTDTVRALNDHFTYVAKPSADGLVRLQVVPGRFTTFWYEPGSVTVAGSIADPARFLVLGTAENQVLTTYKQTIEWPFDRHQAAHPDSAQALTTQRQQRTRAYIAAHRNARTSAYLLKWQTLYNPDLLPEYEQLERRLAPAVRASAMGQELAKRLVIMRTQPLPGRQAPAFTIPDTAGVATSLQSFQGCYVLLDFWGHWCGPCMKAMPKLKQLQAQYGQHVALVGIAMEHAGDKHQWQQAIRESGANWTQLSELNADKGVIEQYNVTAFPTYILLDKQGKVLARGSDLAAMETKLKALP